MEQNQWFVYILRCADNTLYTGITTDLERRVIEHNSDNSLTKYTRIRRPVKLETFHRTCCRSRALQIEFCAKILPRKKKLDAIHETELGPQILYLLKSYKAKHSPDCEVFLAMEPEVVIPPKPKRIRKKMPEKKVRRFDDSELVWNR